MKRTNFIVHHVYTLVNSDVFFVVNDQHFVKSYHIVNFAVEQLIEVDHTLMEERVYTGSRSRVQASGSLVRSV